MSSNFWLTEEQFSKINPLLPNKPRGVPRVDDRRVLSGILFCLRRGYGPARTLYNRYRRWSEPGIFGAGVFARLFETLAREHGALSALMIDARHVNQPPQDASHRGQRGQKNTGSGRATVGPSARPEAG